MEEKGMFRSALGGFNKTDVLNYIDTLTGGWNEERVQLEQQAIADREKAEIAAAKAEELQTAHEAMASELQAMQEELEQVRPLAQQVEQLNEALAQMRAELSEALAQNSQLSNKLAQCEEKSQSARAEMMAAEDRLNTREQELTQRNERLASLESVVAQYEAALGRCDGMKEHIDGIVRPFTESAAHRAEQTLDNTYALVAALLAQLGELQEGIDKQKRALRQEKLESDAKLTGVLGNWFNKAKELAGTAADRATHFFR
jgi:chromosome segregation ATPase